ncbi:MAG TPA: VOC family protein [Candidatus Dormibacteraeota bacterium]|jgi:predicted enzyme related to lactoylglutathione lyase|nr:VOC family protein [Candidatus Dormibacteraeota bacterium]
MPEFTAYPTHTPAWVDVASDDVAASVSFYSGMFGWAAPATADAAGYRLLTLRERVVAGIRPRVAGETRPVWTVGLAVAELGGECERVLAAGGSVVAPSLDAAGAGRLAVVRDPEGAPFGLWQAGALPGVELANEPGTWCWNEVLSGDLDAAIAFYGGLFGWNAERMPREDAVYYELRPAERAVTGLMPVADRWATPMAPHWVVYFVVESCDAAVARAEALGGEVLAPAVDVPVGRFAILADPAGAMFAVVQFAPA